jgi:DNA replication factor GINS
MSGDETTGEPVPGTGEAPLPVQGYVLARVLDNMEPFMGVDGRIYHLMKEDIVTLPRRNAEVLNERNIVLNITPGK